MKGEKRSSLQIYNKLRQFQNELFEIMDKYKLTEWEESALQTLSGVLYMVEEPFVRGEK